MTVDLKTAIGLQAVVLNCQLATLQVGSQWLWRIHGFVLQFVWLSHGVILLLSSIEDIIQKWLL